MFVCTVATAALGYSSAQAQGLWPDEADSDYYGNYGRHDRGYNSDQADYGDDPAVALCTKLGAREDVMHFDLPPLPRNSRASI